MIHVRKPAGQHRGRCSSPTPVNAEIDAIVADMVKNNAPSMIHGRRRLWVSNWVIATEDQHSITRFCGYPRRCMSPTDTTCAAWGRRARGGAAREETRTISRMVRSTMEPSSPGLSTTNGVISTTNRVVKET